ncbi:hypothetical protein AB0O69_18560 [Streptomyces xiamenensis]|uniref:hypothetical protein n=1 Tax=Streptomyces xiamenensis TaxID=408015 RepID=UPI00344142B9
MLFDATTGAAAGAEDGHDILVPQRFDLAVEVDADQRAGVSRISTKEPTEACRVEKVAVEGRPRKMRQSVEPDLTYGGGRTSAGTALRRRRRRGVGRCRCDVLWSPFPSAGAARCGASSIRKD